MNPEKCHHFIGFPTTASQLTKVPQRATLLLTSWEGPCFSNALPEPSTDALSKGAATRFGNRSVPAQARGFHQRRVVRDNSMPMSY